MCDNVSVLCLSTQCLVPFLNFIQDSHHPALCQSILFYNSPLLRIPIALLRYLALSRCLVSFKWKFVCVRRTTTTAAGYGPCPFVTARVCLGSCPHWLVFQCTACGPYAARAPLYGSWSVLADFWAERNGEMNSKRFMILTAWP